MFREQGMNKNKRNLYMRKKEADEGRKKLFRYTIFKGEANILTKHRTAGNHLC